MSRIKELLRGEWKSNKWREYAKELEQEVRELRAQRDAWHRAFRVVRDAYRSRPACIAHTPDCIEHIACMTLAHGFRVMCLLDRLDIARTFRAAEHTGRRS